MPEYTDVMIDIETSGLQPDRNAILQVGAVKFNLETREIDSDFFDEALTFAPFRHWDKGTMDWWAKQPPQVLKDITMRAKPYREVMQQLQQWIVKTPNLRFWSKPTHFDFMFLSSYFSDCDLVNPLNYRTAKDMNTFISGLYYPEPVCQVTEKEVSHDAVAHNALNDCFYQLKLLFAHMDKTGN